MQCIFPANLPPRRMVRDVNNESTLVQVMACCHQDTSQFLNQNFKICDVTRLQWVNTHDIENVLQKQLIAKATSKAQEEVLTHCGLVKLFCIISCHYCFIAGSLLDYPQTSNISCTLVGNNIDDHSDVVGASPVGAAPITLSFLTKHLFQWIGQRQVQDEMRNI